MSASPGKRQRVPAMPPDERRAALVEVTIPLLGSHGRSVTIRQIADAAGVAEGTIFGVFPDKNSLIRSAVIAALDPEPALQALAAAKDIPDLRARLVAVAELLAKRSARNGPLIHLIRGGVCPPGTWPPPELLDARRRITAAIAELIEPDRALLRRTPEMTARLLQSMVMSAGRDPFGEPENLAPHELVSLLLDGLLVQAPHSRETPRADSTAA